MTIEDLNKALKLMQEIQGLKQIEHRMGVVFENDNSFAKSPIVINEDAVIEGFFPNARRNMNEEHYAAMKKECCNFMEKCQAYMTKLRVEKEKEFDNL